MSVVYSVRTVQPPETGKGLKKKKKNSPVGSSLFTFSSFFLLERVEREEENVYTFPYVK